MNTNVINTTNDRGSQMNAGTTIDHRAMFERLWEQAKDYQGDVVALENGTGYFDGAQDLEIHGLHRFTDRHGRRAILAPAPQGEFYKDSVEPVGLSGTICLFERYVEPNSRLCINLKYVRASGYRVGGGYPVEKWFGVLNALVRNYS